MISHCANFEQVKKYSSHFAKFEQVISHFPAFEQVTIKIVILMTLNKSKKTSKTLVGETGCLCTAFFFSQPPLVSSLTLPWNIARFLDPFHTFSLAHRRLIRDFTLPPFECIGIQFF